MKITNLLIEDPDTKKPDVWFTVFVYLAFLCFLLGAFIVIGIFSHWCWWLYHHMFTCWSC